MAHISQSHYLPSKFHSLLSHCPIRIQGPFRSTLAATTRYVLNRFSTHFVSKQAPPNASQHFGKCKSILSLSAQRRRVPH